MKRFVTVLLFASTTFAAGPEHQPQVFPGFNLWLPTSANVPGRFGAYFRTRVSVLNPQNFGYNVSVKLHDSSGSGRTAQFSLAPGEQKTWDDFLGSVFPGATAGALEFDSWLAVPGGSSSNTFLVSAMVYTDEPGGRYGTSLPTFAIPTAYGGTPLAYSAGIEVSARRRTNVGCVNGSPYSSAIVQAEIHASDGSVLGTVQINLSPAGWNQTSVPFPVSNGYVHWRNVEAAWLPLCFAVVVENDSNDGSLILGTDIAD